MKTKNPLLNSFFSTTVFVLFATIFSNSSQADTAVTGNICISSKGAINVRSKCKSNETKGTISSLAAAGAKGSPGAQGPQGNSGAKGATPILGRETSFAAQSVSFPAGQQMTTEQFCPSGKVSVGGGCISNSIQLNLVASYPFDGTPNSWKCTYGNSTGLAINNVSITTLVICADAS